MRRVQRRMQVLRIPTVPAYIQHLRDEPAELERLFRELLISVTEFFRDPATFELLAEKVIPALLAGKHAADALRIWVPGCATGEEAYSIAIALKEAMGTSHGQPSVQIFATDIDDRAITAARAGRFHGPVAGLSPERLQRWFQQEGDDYVVAKSVRELCIFSPHSAIKDPPFMRLDLVSCRNMLIYMNSTLQERLTRVFHYALRPGGYLLLGPSEGLSRNARLFNTIDKKHRLYQSREDADARTPVLPAPRHGAHAGSFATDRHTPTRSAFSDTVERQARRALEAHSPAYVVIDSQNEILRFSGDTGIYLQPTSGAASLDLFALLHKSLRSSTRRAVQQAFAEQRTVIQDGLSLSVDGQRRSLRLIVEPLADIAGAGKLCVVAFREREPVPTPGMDDVDDSTDDRRVLQLEHELRAAQLQLQTAIDQQETAYEELKSANEEYQSVNEEFQSSNEELETSKEEMQSINEELQVVNAELNVKNAALLHANSDLRNLMESTQIAILFLDANLKVSSFTPQITALFHLRASDVGRPITEISARTAYPDLEHDVRQVTRDLGVVERTLQSDADGAVFLMRMRPYRTVDNVINGVVLTFTDITERLRNEVERGLLAAIVDSSKDMIIGHAPDGTITSWNASSTALLGYPAARAIGQSLALLLPADSPQLPDLLVACAQGMPMELEMAWRHEDGSAVQVSIAASPVRDGSGEVVAGSLIARDIGERKRTERHIEMMMGELNHRVKNTLASVQSIALQSLSGATTHEAFKERFLARLQALSETHNLLSRDAWTSVGLREIVLAELAPYLREGQARAEIACDDLKLTPKTALALAMTMHELTTNAAKYGALSQTQGRVAVSCESRRRDGARWLHVEWRERGGPAVTPPSRHGFGTRLIADGLAFELGGEVTLEFAPGGVICIIDAPFEDET